MRGRFELPIRFFDHGLPGYAWYVPKADGYLSVGIGGMAQRLKARDDDIKPHWERFTQLLDRGLAPAGDWEPEGYSYYLRGAVDVVRSGNALSPAMQRDSRPGTFAKASALRCAAACAPPILS